jgi:ATP-binding cassette subfamily B protein
MATTAFLRARRFLNYHPVAQWVAISSSAVLGILFLGLLLLLGLFLDLIVNRGEVRSYAQMSQAERTAFQSDAALPDDPEAAQAKKRETRETLEALRRSEADLRAWFAGEPVKDLPHRERALLWYVTVFHDLQSAVSDDAGKRAAEKLHEYIDKRGLEAAVSQPIGDLGLLGLVVRLRGTFGGGLVANLASWNSWTWASGNFNFLLGLFVLALILAASRFGLLFLSDYMAALASLEAVTRLRRAVYHHTQRLGTLALPGTGPNEAVGASSRHLEVVQDGLFRWLTVFFREPIKAGLLLVFALMVNFWLALAFALFALLIWFFADRASSVLRRQWREAQVRANHQLSLIQESLVLTRLVKAYLMEAFNQARVERQLRAYAEARLARYRGEAISRPLFVFVGLVAALVLLLAAGYVVLQGELGVAAAATLTTALVCLYWPVRAMIETRRAMRRSRDAARGLFAFLDRPGGVGQVVEAEFLPALSEALELDRVTVQEGGNGRKLLRGVTLRIEAGQRIALVGPDDAEKRALVYLLPRFLDPTSGEVRINGKNVRWVTLDSLRAQIALILQDGLIFNDTVANNIGCGDPAYNLHRIVEAAKTAHAHQFIQKLPQGYETVIGEMGHALDAGERFRIALARAILRDPALLIIEEPPASLDDDTKALIDDTMQRLLPNRTVVFLPRRLSTIRSCDQVFLLHQGRIVAAGEHRELLNTNDLYKHLQYLQFNEFAGLHAPAPLAEEPIHKS